MRRKGKEADAERASESETERSERSRRSGSESRSGRVESLHRAVGNQAVQAANRSGTSTTDGGDRLDRTPGEGPREGSSTRSSDRGDPASVGRSASRESDDAGGRVGFELAADRVMRSTEDRSGGSGGSGSPSVEEISPETVHRKRQRGEDVAVVDVRDPSSFRQGHVPGARNVPMSEVSRRPADVEGADEVVSCCRSGRRSKEAARAMADEGGPRVVNMDGGYRRWQREVGGGSVDRSAGGNGGNDGGPGGDCGCEVGTTARDVGDGLQAKLSVSKPGDAREREAERVADQVMRMDDPTRTAGDAAGSDAVAAGGSGGATARNPGGTAVRGSGGVASREPGGTTARDSGDPATRAGSAGPTPASGTCSACGRREATGPTASCSSCGGGVSRSTCSTCEDRLGRTACSSCGDRIQRAVCSDCEELQRATCSACEEDELRRAGGGGRSAGGGDAVGGTQVGGDVEGQVRKATSGGQGLAESTRSYFEPRFGQDFGDVRVHTGKQADVAARSVNAEAFTVGSDIVFRKGAYNPSSEGGKRLLAHELTHVVQQSGGDPARMVARRRAGGGGWGGAAAVESGGSGGAGGGSGGGSAQGSGKGPKGTEPFLPMQIRCVREAGGCGIGGAALGPINDMCRAGGGVIGQGTGYEGPDLRQEDLECGTSTGQVVADAVQSAYSGWTGVLPDCPCTVEGARQSSEFVNTTGPWSESMHTGAEYDFRAAGYSTAAGTNHGQQCMYDGTGQLITAGAGRGTPDVWSPQPKTYFPYHYAIDVMTAKEISASQYRGIWTPNTGKRCPDNRPGSSGGSGGSGGAGSGGAAGGAGGAGGARTGSGGGSSGGSGGSASRAGGETCGGCTQSGWEPGSNGCSVPGVVTELGGGIEGFDVDAFHSADRPLGEDGPAFAEGCGGDGPCDVHDRDYQTCKSDFAKEKVSELPDPATFDSHESYWQAHRAKDTLLVNYGWKEKADRKFEEGMKQACAQRYEGETAWFSDTPYEDCLEVAEVYAAGVSDAFSDAYAQRQYQACTCDLMKNPGSLMGNVSEGSWTRMFPGVGAGSDWPW